MITGNDPNVLLQEFQRKLAAAEKERDEAKAESAMWSERFIEIEAAHTQLLEAAKAVDEADKTIVSTGNVNGPYRRHMQPAIGSLLEAIALAEGRKE